MRHITRRELIKRLTFGLAATQVAAVCVGCASPSKTSKKASASDQPPANPAADKPAPSPVPKQDADPQAARELASEGEQTPAGRLDCTDTSGLSDPQIRVREALKYTDQSPKSDQTCDNCQLYKTARSTGECGGCQTVPGPIHPKGWCTAWVARS